MGYLIVALVAVALIGLPLGYLRLCGAMREAAIERPPRAHFFFVFGSVGGLLLTLTLAGSPLGALASVVPVICGPLVILISSIVLYPRYRDSRFHSAAFWSGLAYLGLTAIMVSIAASIQS